MLVKEADKKQINNAGQELFSAKRDFRYMGNSSQYHLNTCAHTTQQISHLNLLGRLRF